MTSGDLIADQIRAVLDLTRPLVVLDFETTGTSPEADRAISLAMIRVMPEADKARDAQFSTLIRPGIPIPPESTETHHLTDAMVNVCRTCGAPGPHLALHAMPDTASPGMFIEAHNYLPRWPTFAELAPDLIDTLTGVDLAGKNIRRFDVPLLTAEFVRSGRMWEPGDSRFVDVDRIWQIVEPRTLADGVRRFCKQEMVGAHDAVVDTEWTGAMLAGQLREFGDRFGRSVDTIHALSWPDAIDPEGKFKFIKGVPCIAFGKKYKAGTPMRNIEPGFYRWMLGQSFSPFVKRLAADAIKGIYPVAPAAVIADEAA